MGYPSKAHTHHSQATKIRVLRTVCIAVKLLILIAFSDRPKITDGSGIRRFSQV